MVVRQRQSIVLDAKIGVGHDRTDVDPVEQFAVRASVAIAAHVNVVPLGVHVHQFVRKRPPRLDGTAPVPPFLVMGGRERGRNGGFRRRNGTDRGRRRILVHFALGARRGACAAVVAVLVAIILPKIERTRIPSDRHLKVARCRFWTPRRIVYSGRDGRDGAVAVAVPVPAAALRRVNRPLDRIGVVADQRVRHGDNLEARPPSEADRGRVPVDELLRDAVTIDLAHPSRGQEGYHPYFLLVFAFALAPRGDDVEREHSQVVAAARGRREGGEETYLVGDGILGTDDFDVFPLFPGRRRRGRRGRNVPLDGPLRARTLARGTIVHFHGYVAELTHITIPSIAVVVHPRQPRGGRFGLHVFGRSNHHRSLIVVIVILGRWPSGDLAYHPSRIPTHIRGGDVVSRIPRDVTLGTLEAEVVSISAFARLVAARAEGHFEDRVRGGTLAVVRPLDGQCRRRWRGFGIAVAAAVGVDGDDDGGAGPIGPRQLVQVLLLAALGEYLLLRRGGGGFVSGRTVAAAVAAFGTLAVFQSLGDVLLALAVPLDEERDNVLLPKGAVGRERRQFLDLGILDARAAVERPFPLPAHGTGHHFLPVVLVVAELVQGPR
mmetsp:Transcript_20512/g.59491  ORF Transcript_20512/g.59491 Transcript_20512/m.59491 type:complete len:605 (-) Transcript_20512:1091-2905(-)